MNHHLTIPIIGPGVLTTDHSASSYGCPVFVASGGQVYGPGDLACPEIDMSLTAKAMALSSNQYTGSSDRPWPQDVCEAVKAW